MCYQLKTFLGANANPNIFGPSVAVQAVSLSDDGTTIIIDFFSSSFCQAHPKPQLN